MEKDKIRKNGARLKRMKLRKMEIEEAYLEGGLLKLKNFRNLLDQVAECRCQIKTFTNVLIGSWDKYEALSNQKCSTEKESSVQVKQYIKS